MLSQHTEDLGATCIATSVWLLAQVANGMPPFMEVFLENSAWAALVFFFVWTSWKREERLGTRVEELEKQTPVLLREVLSAMDRNTDAVAALNEAMGRLQSTVEDNQS